MRLSMSMIEIINLGKIMSFFFRKQEECFCPSWVARILCRMEQSLVNSCIRLAIPAFGIRPSFIGLT
jgi:hypothetical protein